MSLLATALLARSEDPMSQLLGVVVILVISAIGWIVNKMRESQEASKKRPLPRIPPPRTADDEASDEIFLPRPTARQNRPSPPMRPMPQVPRAGGRPVPPLAPRPMPVPQPVPVPSRAKVRSRPVPARRPVEVEVVREGPAPSRVAPAQEAERVARSAEEKARRLAEAEQRQWRTSQVQLAPGVQKVAFTRAKLREAIILNEILSPPLAIREADSLSAWS